MQPGEIKLAALYLECTLKGYLKYYIDFWLTRNRVCDSTGRWIRGQVLEQGVERNYWKEGEEGRIAERKFMTFTLRLYK